MAQFAIRGKLNHGSAKSHELQMLSVAKGKRHTQRLFNIRLMKSKYCISQHWVIVSTEFAQDYLEFEDMNVSSFNN